MREYEVKLLVNGKCIDMKFFSNSNEEALEIARSFDGVFLQLQLLKKEKVE